MTKLAKTFSAPRYNALIGIVLACVMGSSHLLRSVLPAKAIAQDYPVQGFDVSHHQENINWKNITQKFQFVYLKATEGGDYKDPEFQENWLKAREHGSVGALSFYRLCRDGKTQKLKILLQPYPTKLMPFLLLLIWNMTATVLIPIPKNNYLKK